MSKLFLVGVFAFALGTLGCSADKLIPMVDAMNSRNISSVLHYEGVATAPGFSGQVKGCTVTGGMDPAACVKDSGE